MAGSGSGSGGAEVEGGEIAGLTAGWDDSRDVL